MYSVLLYGAMALLVIATTVWVWRRSKNYGHTAAEREAEVLARLHAGKDPFAQTENTKENTETLFAGIPSQTVPQGHIDVADITGAVDIEQLLAGESAAVITRARARLEEPTRVATISDTLPPHLGAAPESAVPPQAQMPSTPGPTQASIPAQPTPPARLAAPSNTTAVSAKPATVPVPASADSWAARAAALVESKHGLAPGQTPLKHTKELPSDTTEAMEQALARQAAAQQIAERVLSAHSTISQPTLTIDTAVHPTQAHGSTHKTADERLAAERFAAKKLAAARLAQQQKTQALEAEHLEAQRIAAEKALAARKEAERIEAQRIEAEKALAARKEAERIEAQRQFEKRRLAALEAEQALIAERQAQLAKQKAQQEAARKRAKPLSPSEWVDQSLPLRELALAWFEARGYRSAPASSALHPIERVLRHHSDPTRVYGFVVENNAVDPERVGQLRAQGKTVGLERLMIIANAGTKGLDTELLRKKGVRVVDHTALEHEFSTLDFSIAAKIVAVAHKRAALAQNNTSAHTPAHQ